MSAPQLGPGAEFDRIRGFLKGAKVPAHVWVGPGDDAAVLDSGIVLSTDLSMEGVHFRFDWLTPEEVGWRAAAAAVSDLAAMGARPLGALVSVAVPAPGTLADALMAGVRDLLDAFGMPLLGGDLTRSLGPALLDVVVVGETQTPLLRSGARVGDGVWVTGSIHGAPQAALEAWLKGEAPSDSARACFARPRPRVLEARWLMDRRIPTAGLDLSDGLSGDAGHLAAASGVQIELDGRALQPCAHVEPTDPTPTTALHRALFGGEGYELFLTIPPQRAQGWVEEFEEQFDLSMTRVGTVRPGSGVVWIPAEGGAPRPLDQGGWDHFAPALETTPARRPQPEPPHP